MGPCEVIGDAFMELQGPPSGASCIPGWTFQFDSVMETPVRVQVPPGMVLEVSSYFRMVFGPKGSPQDGPGSLGDRYE